MCQRVLLFVCCFTPILTSFWSYLDGLSNEQAFRDNLPVIINFSVCDWLLNSHDFWISDDIHITIRLKVRNQQLSRRISAEPAINILQIRYSPYLLNDQAQKCYPLRKIILKIRHVPRIYTSCASDLYDMYLGFIRHVPRIMFKSSCWQYPMPSLLLINTLLQKFNPFDTLRRLL